MTRPQSTAPRVFISYSHDSPEHETKVLALANRLRQDGVDALIDQYVPAPPNGFPIWMDLEIQQADFVLLVCTETYLRRVERREAPGKGRGVMWEANLIYTLLYTADPDVQKFIPILFENGTTVQIPTPLRTMTHYLVETGDGYEGLYRHLTSQPRNPVPELGELKTLPTVESPGYVAPPLASKADETVRPSPRHNLPPRNPHFVGRTSELRSIHVHLNRRISLGVPRQIAIHGHGGLGKTSLATEYAWKYLSNYPGGVFFIDCSSDYKKQIAELAPRLGIPDADPLDIERTAPLVKERLESAPQSLLVLDNVEGSDQWTSDTFRGCMPAGECRRLITGRDGHLPDVPMLRAERLPAHRALQLLAQRRPDAKKKINAPFVTKIVESLDGLAASLTYVGIYMARLPELSWESYAASIDRKGLHTLLSTEKLVGKLGDYTRPVESAFEDLLKTLSPVECRALEYASILPQGNIYPAWLNTLLDHDPDLPAEHRPGWTRTGDAALAELRRELLLVQQNEGSGALSLQRVLRQLLHDRLTAAGGHYQVLLQRILALADDEISETLGSPFGRVKWFNPAKGFGFISVRNGPDVFVHISAVERAGLRSLTEGELIFFELATNQGKTYAAGLARPYRRQ